MVILIMNTTARLVASTIEEYEEEQGGIQGAL